MKWLIYEKTEMAIIARTVVEFVLSWLATNLPDIMGLIHVPELLKGLLIGVFMVFITEILSLIRKNKPKDDTEE